MKIQDLGFLLILAGLFYFRKIRLISLTGIICLILAMPLFAFWVFFTAQRLVIYAAVLFAISLIGQIWQSRKEKQ